MKNVVRTAAGAIAAAGLVVLAFAPVQGFAQAPGFCAQIASLTASGLAAGATNGIVGIPPAGQQVTMTATLGTASAGTFRIVGDPAGTVTFAGPTAIPGTLGYATTGTLPAGAIGVGYFIDTAVGGTVNVTASCGAIQVPTMSQWGLMLTSAILLALGGAALLRRRRR
jgi:hypothetical protein